MMDLFGLGAVLFVSLMLGMWRLTLGGYDSWLANSFMIKVGFLWNPGPKLRRGSWYPFLLIPIAPLWLAEVPIWLTALVSVCVAVQFVWPGRDFSNSLSLLVAHGLWALVSSVAMGMQFNDPLAALPFLAPPLIALGYRVLRNEGHWTRRAEFLTGFAVGACNAAPLFLLG
jgi:hypothetical protein